MAAWLADLPGRSFRALARSAMDANRQHAALDWLDWASQSERFRLLAVDDETPRLRALVLLRLNLLALAMESLAEAERRGGDPQTLAMYRDLAETRRGNLEAAERIWDQGQEFLPAQAIFEAVAWYGQSNGRYDWALHTIDLWQDQFPGDAAAFYHRGRMYELQTELESALVHYRRAVEVQPSLHRASYRMGLGLQQQRDYQEAETFFRRCLDSPYEPIARIELADCLWQRGQNDLAWETIEPVLDQTPSALSVLYLQVEEFLDEDRVAITAARIRDSQDRPEEAIALWERVIAYNHRNPEAHGSLAAILRRVGRDKKAAQHAAIQEQMLAMRQRCAELRLRTSDHPEDLEARIELAELLLQCESPAAAQLVVQEILVLDPDNREALRLRAEVYREMVRTSPEFANLARQQQRKAQ